LGSKDKGFFFGARIRGAKNKDFFWNMDLGGNDF
jgi:hypothetical protein